MIPVQVKCSNSAI